MTTAVAKADAEPIPDAEEVDLAEPLADGDAGAPGDVNTPGSPAWESVDAATAQKWIAVASRLKNALDVMSAREGMEGAAGASDDWMSQMDLEDMACAADFIISGLASFAVGEANESMFGAEAMDVMKSFPVDALETVEGYAPLLKAGRVLSSANEAKIRDAAKALESVLASLPSAPAAEAV